MLSPKRVCVREENPAPVGDALSCAANSEYLHKLFEKALDGRTINLVHPVTIEFTVCKLWQRNERQQIVELLCSSPEPVRVLQNLFFLLLSRDLNDWLIDQLWRLDLSRQELDSFDDCTVPNKRALESFADAGGLQALASDSLVISGVQLADGCSHVTPPSRYVSVRRTPTSTNLECTLASVTRPFVLQPYTDGMAGSAVIIPKVWREHCGSPRRTYSLHQIYLHIVGHFPSEAKYPCSIIYQDMSYYSDKDAADLDGVNRRTTIVCHYGSERMVFPNNYLKQGIPAKYAREASYNVVDFYRSCVPNLRKFSKGSMPAIMTETWWNSRIETEAAWYVDSDDYVGHILFLDNFRIESVSKQNCCWSADDMCLTEPRLVSEEHWKNFGGGAS